MVFTAHYLRSRGYCCRSGCRHCPYGFSLGAPVEASAAVPQGEDAPKTSDVSALDSESPAISTTSLSHSQGDTDSLGASANTSEERPPDKL